MSRTVQLVEPLGHWPAQA